MGKKAGALLWRRERITLAPGVTTVDTGLTQLTKNFADLSPNEPPLGVGAAPPGPADGTLPASRVMVIPMAPTASWASVTHGEPFVNSTTGNVNVTFNNAVSPAAPVTINVLFWDPHALIGPGQADTYHA
jgi:hypothetical protein